MPTNTGNTVQLETPAPAAAVISALMRKNAENIRVWKTYTDTDKVCKKKLLSLVPEVYYRALKKQYTAYARVTCLTLLTHRHIEYWRLTSQDIDEIDKRMKNQISETRNSKPLSNKFRTDRNPWPFKTPTQTSKL